MKQIITWLFIISSAVLYVLPFIYIKQLWWLSYLFLTVLAIRAYQVRLSFTHGFIWGIIAFSIHLSGVMYSLFCMADESAFYIPILSIIALLYLGLISGIWFTISYYIQNFLQKYISLSRIISTFFAWLISSMLFFEFLHRAILWPFGILEGYFWAYPLLPFVQFPPILYTIPVSSIAYTHVLFCWFSMLPIVLFIVKNWLIKLLISIPLGLYILSFFVYSLPVSKKPAWLNDIIYIPQSFYCPHHQAHALRQATHVLKKAITKHPDKKLFLLPESSLYLCDLSQYAPYINQWALQNKLSPTNNIIIGGLRKQDHKTYNTIYWIQNGKIKRYYDKKHALALTERLPWWAYMLNLQKLYYSERPILNTAHNKRPAFLIDKKLSIIPFICSEIFFMVKPDFDYSIHIPIASLCNDSWIFAPYLQNLMQATHAFKAIEWSRPIMYISYHHGILYMPNGHIFAIDKIL